MLTPEGNEADGVFISLPRQNDGAKPGGEYAEDISNAVQ
jgi:hypothetical protein